MEWTKSTYNSQYEKWMPWIEDQYLYYFTKDNKASYATKDTLDKGKVTGVEPVDKLQDGLNSTVSGQVGKGGLLQPVGDYASKEGVNRAERGGKDDSGGYMSSMGNMGSGAAGYAKSGAGAVGGAASSVGGYFTGGGKKQGEGEQKQQEKK